MQVERTKIDFADWGVTIPARLKRKGWRFGHLTVRRTEDGCRLIEALLLNLIKGSVEVVSASIPDGASEFPSITTLVPAAHWAERVIGDFWGLRASGHPRWKSLILHEAWSAEEFPFSIPSEHPIIPRDIHFLTVKGEGVHEIPVGPIHAGIIEPGHFRFSCIGEVIANLEIRLGYQHRGLEMRLSKGAWQATRHIAESASSDSAVSNALAHSVAIEGLLNLQVPQRAEAARTISLEIERIASHLGDLAGMAADLGFALGAGTFGRLRGTALGLGQSLSGTRFQRGFICPGGIAWDVTDGQLASIARSVPHLRDATAESCDLFLGNPGVQERLQGVGILQTSLAGEFGMVGPSARASGSRYDARSHFPHGLYPELPVSVFIQSSGDALARMTLRREELFHSLEILQDVLGSFPQTPHRVALPENLPNSRVGVGIVESWRGELIHWITTDKEGTIARYTIRDPSFQNWTGLAIAARRNVIADFPLINKSFSLSYSGNDL